MRGYSPKVLFFVCHNAAQSNNGFNSGIPGGSGTGFGSFDSNNQFGRQFGSDRSCAGLLNVMKIKIDFYFPMGTRFKICIYFF